MSEYLAIRDGGKTNEEGALRFLAQMLLTKGVLGSSHLQVTEEGTTPDKSVDIAVGDILIAEGDYVYHGWNDAVYNLTMTDNTSGDPRIDAVVAYVDKSVVSDATSNNPGAHKFTAVAGTPSASPSAPSDSDIQTAIGAGNPFKRLANLTLPHNYTTIENSDIEDTRDQGQLDLNRSALSGFTHGDILYVNSSGELARLPAGTDGNLLKTQGTSANPAWSGLNIDGWITATGTWSYSSWDADTRIGEITVPTDAITKYSVGMRIRISQSTGGTKYGIIVKVEATALTVYFGTDYTLNNEAISSPFYSTQKAPFGFPLSPTKWTLEAVDTTQRFASSTTTWTNLGSLSLNIPIGSWDVEYLATGYNNLNADIYTTLSTANSTESDSQMTALSGGEAGIGDSRYRSKTLYLATATPYYLNTKAVTASGNMHNLNNVSPAIIRAKCAYL